MCPPPPVDHRLLQSRYKAVFIMHALKEMPGTEWELTKCLKASEQ